MDNSPLGFSLASIRITISSLLGVSFDIISGAVLSLFIKSTIVKISSLTGKTIIEIGGKRIMTRDKHGNSSE